MLSRYLVIVRRQDIPDASVVGTLGHVLSDGELGTVSSCDVKPILRYNFFFPNQKFIDIWRVGSTKMSLIAARDVTAS